MQEEDAGGPAPSAMPPEGKSSRKGKGGRYRTACAACRLARKKCEAELPCDRYEIVHHVLSLDVFTEASSSSRHDKWCPSQAYHNVMRWAQVCTRRDRLCTLGP